MTRISHAETGAISIRTPVPGPRSRALLEERRRFVAVGISEAKHGIFFERAEGARLIDVDGNVFLDFSGGIGCLNVGHSAPRVVDRAREQLTRLQHACFQVAPYEPYVALARKLCQIVPIGGPTKAALFNSGAEAVENAIKIARSATGRAAVLAFDPGFHGRTLLALSLTSKAFPYRQGFGPFAPEVYRVPIPDVLRRPPGTSVQTSVEHGIAELHRFLKSTVDPSSIACAIVEPVIGEGGFIVPPLEFLLDLSRTCREHGIVFIADEVQTGFGRTGRMFACERFGLEPDLMCLAKSLSNGFPLSAVVGRSTIMDAVRPGGLGGTFAGNPVSCAAALGAIETLERDGLLDRAETIGAVVAKRFESLAACYPFVAEARGVGAMRALELVEDRVSLKPDQGRTERILALAATRGLLLLSAGLYGNVIRTLMPLTMTDTELDEGLDVLESCFADAA
ncbi:MAG TPA: 4-aminobutyrate--2-oxoglutarate transaminase [Vicinamibacterales bacterium]|jgi:4-aminobutyrate aminotransferase/(S)-3-amino-2-methylpropionate transaminase